MNKLRRFHPVILAASAATLLGVSSSQAVNYTWDTVPGDGSAITPGNGIWDLNAGNLIWNDNGSNVPWVNGNTAVFGGADGTYAITLDAAVTSNGLTFLNSGYTISAPGARTITMGTSLISVASGKTATIGSNVTLSRAGAYHIGGGGQLILTGTMTNSGTTASEIFGGSTLEIATGGTLTYSASPVIGANSTQTNPNGHMLISGGTVAVNGTSNFVIGNLVNTTTTASTTINAGSLTVISTSANGIRFGSNNPSGGTVNGTFNLDGGTVTTPGVTRFTGAGTINATFNFNGGVLRANRATAGTSTAFMSGAMTTNVKAGGAKIDSNGFDILIGQNLLDAGGGGGLEKLGTGTLTLTGANTYTGTTTITAGTLQIGNGGTVGTLGTGAIVNHGALTINRSNAFDLSNGISGSGGVTLTGGGTYTFGGTNTYIGATNINAGRADLTGTFTSNIAVASGANLGGEGSTTGSLTFGGTHTLFFDPATSAHLTANTINASAATITLNPTNATAGSGIIVLEAPGGISGTVGTNFLFTGRGSASLNAGNTQLLFTATPGAIKWTGANGTNPTFWDVQTTTNWLNGASPDTFFTGDAVTFDETATTFAVAIQGASVQPASVTFNNTTTYTLTGGEIAGSGSVVKNGGGTVILANANTYSGTTTINAGTIQLGDGTNAAGSFGTGAVTNDAAIVTNFGVNNATVASAIGGTGTLTQSGTGTVSLTGENTYSGLTTINAGTLQIGAGGTTGTLGTGAVVNNGTLVFNRSDSFTQTNAISGSGGVTKLGAGTLTLGSANTYAGVTTISGGAILVTAGSGVLGSTAAGTVVTGTGAAVHLQGDIVVAGEALTLVGEGVNASSNPGALRNVGGSNEWTGALSIDPAATATSIHRVVSESGFLKVSGNVALGPDSGDQFVLQGNGDGEVSGVISGAMRLTRSVTGSGIWTLSGANTYTGKTTISNSVLRVSSLNSVAGGTASSSLGAPTTVANGTIDFGNTTFSGGLIYTGTGETTDRVINLAAAGSGGGTIEQAGTGLLRFTSNLTAINATTGTKTLGLLGSTAGTGEFAGVIGNGASTVGVTKSGTGTWTLSGANTYTGPTNVTAGTLAVAASGSISGSTSINVSGGATLDVSAVVGGLALGSTQTLTGGTGETIGTVLGGLTAGAGSTVAPGLAAGTTGRLSISSGFSLEATAHLSLDLTGSVAGSGYDQLLVNAGNISLAGDLDGSTLTFTPAIDDVFYIILNNGTGTTSGTLGGVVEGGLLTIGSQQFQISYTSDFGGAGFEVGGDGNDVALLAVPEPGTAASLLGGVGVLLGLRRRRRG